MFPQIEKRVHLGKGLRVGPHTDYGGLFREYKKLGIYSEGK